MWRRLSTAIALVVVVWVGQASLASASPPKPAVASTQERAVQGALKQHGLYAVAGDAILVSRKDLNQSHILGTGGAPSAAAAGSPPWKSCGVFDKKNKLLKDYGRQKLSGVAGKTGHLRCGHQDFLKSTGWGLRHIESGHLSQWKSKAAMLAEPWQTFANWTWVQTLKAPSSKRRQPSNDTLVYKTPIQIKNSRGQVLDQFTSVVVIARVSQNFITAYPAG